MDVIRNPFSPSAGSQPPELVGRGGILEQARILLGRVKQKRCEKSMWLTGLRGVGKTVLLNEIDRLAKREGYHTVLIEAYENRALGPLIVSHHGFSIFLTWGHLRKMYAARALGSR